ncbi:hypothetical protein JCM5353_006956 [Sporobolomyces roseus]
MIKGQASEGHARELLEIARTIQETSQDLSLCGNAVFSLLSRIFTLLETSSSTVTLGSDAPSLSTSLLCLSNEKINSYPYREVPLCWRRLYTDSTLLKSISQLHEHDTSEDVLLGVIRDLDLALIVAGAPGQNRSQLLFKIISIAQSLLPSNAASNNDPRPLKRPRISNNPTRLDPPYLARPIPILPSLPDFLLPSSDPSHQRPSIVRSVASEWTATEKWKDVEYLRSIGGGRGRVVPVEVGNDYTKEGWGQRIIPWHEFLNSMFHQTGANEEGEKETFYLAQHSLLTQFPSLSRDFPIPSLVYSDPPALEDYPEYTPPTNEEGWIMNAWLGKGGTVSQAHTDPFWNCYVQVVGSKWVWIAPPSVGSHMATFGGTSPSTVDTDDQEGEQSTATEFMTNTSTIDVTQSLPSSSTTSPDTSSYYPPAFLQEVESKAQQIVLEAGDVLVMPPGWWHAMKSLETSFSISIWF